MLHARGGGQGEGRGEERGYLSGCDGNVYVGRERCLQEIEGACCTLEMGTGSPQLVWEVRTQPTEVLMTLHMELELI